MDLPIYNHLTINSVQIDDLKSILHKEINLNHPVVFHLKSLLLDEQREIIGLIENFFDRNNISFKFPYPVYLVTDHEKTITHMATVKKTQHLPEFFSQKVTKLNIKESHIVSKNKLLQYEIKNVDSQLSEEQIQNYGLFHKQISNLENERTFYKMLLERLTLKA